MFRRKHDFERRRTGKSCFCYKILNEVLIGLDFNETRSLKKIAEEDKKIESYKKL